MITVKHDRSVYIPECDRHIGYENDNLVESRIFEICDSELFNFSFKLDLKKTKDIVDLDPCGETETSRLYCWNITSAAIGEGGSIIAQIRAFNESGEKVWHSEWLEFVAEPSVNGEKQIEDERIISEFEQLEIRVQQAVNAAETAAMTAKEYAEDSASGAQSASTDAQIADAEKSLAEAAALSAESSAKNALQSENNAHASAESAFKAAVSAEECQKYLSEKMPDFNEFKETVGSVDQALDTIISIENLLIEKNL